MASNPNPNFDESQWLIDIVRAIEKGLESDQAEIPVCIFNVPKTLMSSDPTSYTPQEVAIGPYHFGRPEVYDMERHKLAAVKRTQRLLHGDQKLKDIVDQLNELEPRIRACYHKFLDFKNETLAWMMAIDASFLLEFLQIYAIKEAKDSRSVSSYAPTKAAQNAILRDMVMLENQIPLFVLRKMLEVQYPSLESADVRLQAMLMGFCEELSPFKTMKDLPNIPFTECYHLLDYLYDTIVPKAQQIEITEVEDQGGAKQQNETFSGDPTYVKELLSKGWKLFSGINKGPIKKVLESRPVQVLTKLSKLPGISALGQRAQDLLFSQYNEGKNPENESSNSSNGIYKSPLVEEITVPSVTELAKSQVQFVAASGDISTISFDLKKATLQLPIINLDVNTEVVMRNLVAYEASNASGPMAFARYTEFMNGIIDSEEDVKLLREKGIIRNRLKSDTEVANLWNEMSKSIRLTKVPLIDKVIEDVNKYHNSRWNVKFGNSVRHYVYGSWQILTLLATILLLLLMTLEAVCSVYECRNFNITSTSNSTSV